MKVKVFLILIENKRLLQSLWWKHESSHLLDNLISPLDSGIQTRSKACNLVAYSAFISVKESKSIKEALKDLDWVVSMQEDLHQFE